MIFEGRIISLQSIAYYHRQWERRQGKKEGKVIDFIKRVGIAQNYRQLAGNTTVDPPIF
jgi:hypothetical protein